MLAKLNIIKDGETMHLTDSWPYTFGKGGGDIATDGMAGADLTLALGNSNLNSLGDFLVTRQGDELVVEGEVKHRINDPYDFHGDSIYAPDARALEKSGKAKPYVMKSQWSEPVRGTVKIVRDESGQIRRVDPKFTWGDKSRLNLEPKRP